jgi:ATP-dependent helicase/nuclease subunit B
MTDPFLKSVAEYIYEHYKDSVEKVGIVLPNKRGALFLKNYLALAFGKTIWLPTIISAEELVAELSGLKTLEEIDLICHLYESYKTCYGPDAEPFDSFAKWGQLILQDFNEIDRYLADPEQLYDNLKNIKEIENWSLGAEILTDYQSAYLKFMNSLGAIYRHFTGFLIANRWAYQGLAYRQAVLNQERSDYPDRFHKLLFCGFNALNAAEIKIIHRLHIQKKAELLWDADRYYLDNADQEAGLFLRRNFELFQEKEPFFVQDNFKEDKSIRVISVPKQIGQAQVVKQSLQALIDQGVAMDRVAVVLANEKLLWPVLQQLPPAIEHVNITMEYPLRYTATYGFIDLLLQLQTAFARQNRAQKTIYHKDLVGILRQPLFWNYAKAKNCSLSVTKLIQELSTRNLSFISQAQLQQLLGENYTVLAPLFQPAASVSRLCEVILDVLQSSIAYFSEHKSSNQKQLELEYLHILLRNFNRLGEILARYPHFNDIHSFRQLYNQVVGNATAPFIGEPLRGLQIMGVLETRTLDFDHLILVNVNEGVLPSGKSMNSFIPNDLKRAFGLPLYLEKDAIYAYHFYRLLQRAKSVIITYDSETDTFGKGEKSRFVTQLELEMTLYNPGIRLTEEVATYQGFQEKLANVISIHKTPEVLSPILQKAGGSQKYEGLSPSGLITFKDCGLRYYFRYGAHLKETEQVEESAEANTFGSILHLSLESLYKPFTGKVIQASALNEQLALVDSVVHQSFVSFFDNNEPACKNLLQEEVIKVYVK